MNKQDTGKIHTFPTSLDEEVNAKFKGAKCSSRFSLNEMAYVTTWQKGHKKAKEISAFVAGFMAGNEELGKRLRSKE